MSVKRTFLALLIGMYVLGLTALTLPELKYQVSMLTDIDYLTTEVDGEEVVLDEDFEQANQLFIQFVLEEDDLDDLEEAVFYWEELMPEECEAWLEEQTSHIGSSPKLLYLWLLFQEDPLSNINAARHLIQNYPHEVYGYRLMLLTYTQNLPVTQIADDEDAAREMLALDISHMLTYYQGFPNDTYHRMAGIFAYNHMQQMDTAKDILKSAFFDNDRWIDLIDINAMQPIDEYHELMAYFLQLFKNNTYQGAREDLGLDLMEYLGEYYFDNQLYEQAIDVLIAADGSAPDYFYQRYMLASSLIEIGDKQRATQVVLYDENAEYASMFMDFWRQYLNPNLYVIYQDLLEDNDTILARYLLGKLEPNGLNSLAAARQILRIDRLSPLGYGLLSQTYWGYFTSEGAKGNEREQWLKEFSLDKGRIRAYYLRFPDDKDASQAYMLLQILSNNSENVLEIVKKELETNPLGDTIQEAEIIVADTGNFDLLWDINAAAVKKYTEIAILNPQEAPSFEILGFAHVLYITGHFDELIARVNANPDWLLEEDVQYMAVNSNLYQENYGDAIALLHMMLTAETVYPMDVLQLEDEPIAEHPDWPALEAYARELWGDDTEAEESFEEATADFYPAPGWTLPDIDGNLVSLSDFRGKIVILDFWATWCGPCTRAMPVLHEWMINDMPQGVEVFSINIWEDDISASTYYMDENQFAMRLLFGDEQIAENYQVEGIPCIVIIDGNGMIRHRELGFNSKLSDNLNKVIKEIREEG